VSDSDRVERGSSVAAAGPDTARVPMFRRQVGLRRRSRTGRAGRFGAHGSNQAL